MRIRPVAADHAIDAWTPKRRSESKRSCSTTACRNRLKDNLAFRYMMLRVCRLVLLLLLPSTGRVEAVRHKVVAASDSVKLICIHNIPIGNLTKVEWMKAGVGPVAAMYLEHGRIQSVSFGVKLRDRATLKPHILEIFSTVLEDSGIYSCLVEKNYFVVPRLSYAVHLTVSDDTSKCGVPPVKGPCRAKLRRWHYNEKTRDCAAFQYGGCGGNRNNFKTRKACEKKCKKRSESKRNAGYSVCNMAPARGSCERNIPRWYYDGTAGVCATFVYGGCGGNGNNFKNPTSCEKKCGFEKQFATEKPFAIEKQFATKKPFFTKKQFAIKKQFVTKKQVVTKKQFVTKKPFAIEKQSATQNVATDYPEQLLACHQPPIIGSCKKNQTVWYYNTNSRRCETFAYSGCGGNRNKFVTKAKCQLICIMRMRCRKPTCPLSCDYGFVRSASGCDMCQCQKGPCKTIECKNGTMCREYQPFCYSLPCLPVGKCITRPPFCSMPPLQGACDMSIRAWYFDPSTLQCREFIYRGCGGNSNRFIDSWSCHESCGMTKIS
ncbi:Boophilin-H2 [Lamellibrachia satsuma]|nr:Boophilin-H2 [Lamellibrachia satsuma]